MIYTITFNPALDYHITVNNYHPGEVNRTSAERLSAGGKGLNVSTVLHQLGVSTMALGFLAGPGGD
ncbi:MAG: 1-phosphofructokinase, partial [Oscillospiraceae bacterium]|nr:1-phosphofructokinase [Oscillospiraceae bacterium]